MAYKLGEPTVQQYFDANGDPLVNGSIEFYVTGTSTPAAVASDSAGGATATSYTLNSIGAPQTAGGTAIALYFDDTVTYKIVRKDAAGTVIDPTIDPYNVVNSAGGQLVVDSVATLYSNDQSAFTNATTQAFTAGGTVGRADWYKSGTGGTPTTAGTLLTDLALGYVVDAGGNYWYIKVDGTNTVYQWGATGSGDDYDEITAALTFMSSNTGVLYGDTHTVNTTIVIPGNVTLDLRNGSFIPGSDIDVVQIRQGAQLRNVKADMRSATTGFAYTSQYITFSPTNNVQGRLYLEWLNNIDVLLDIGAGNGDGITIDASTYYVMELRATNVAVWRGNSGVNLIAGTTGQWITHCSFVNFHLTDNFYHVYTEEDVSGNIFVGGATEKNTYGSFHISGGGNKFLMTIQDGPNITIARDANDGCDANYFHQVSGVDLPTITDEGHNTRIIGRGYEYFDGAMITGYRNDWRGNIRSGGRQEFVDMMLAGPDPLWTQSTTGTGSIVAASGQFGIASGFEQNIAYTQMTLAADNDTATLDLNGVKPWATGRRPTIHATVGEASTNTLAEIGLYNDANNYILIKFDGTGTGGATGSGNWHVETCSSGTATTQTMTGSAGTNRVTLFTLKITDTSIKIWYGEWNISNGGSSGQLSKWAQIIESTDPDYEITTNIPSQVAMEQRIYAEADGGSASYKVFDIQYRGNRKEFR